MNANMILYSISIWMDLKMECESFERRCIIYYLAHRMWMISKRILKSKLMVKRYKFIRYTSPPMADWHIYKIETANFTLDLSVLYQSHLSIARIGIFKTRATVSATSSESKIFFFSEIKSLFILKLVSTDPGQIAATRILYSLTSSIRDFVKPINACLVALYIVPPIKAFFPAREEILIIEPLRFAIIRSITAFVKL